MWVPLARPASLPPDSGTRQEEKEGCFEHSHKAQRGSWAKNTNHCNWVRLWVWLAFQAVRLLSSLAQRLVFVCLLIF